MASIRLAREASQSVGKVIANVLLGALTIALTIFTASRTLDLLSQWLPVNQAIYTWLGLAAFEGGFILWCLFFASAAKGSVQRGVSFLMILFCFLGIAVATISDLVLTGAKDGRLPAINANLQQAIVVFIGIVIVVNVGAFAAAKLISPEKLRQWARQDAQDKIFEEEHKAIRELAPYVAANMAPIQAQQWAQQMWGELLPGVATVTAIPQPQAQLLAPASLPQTRQIAAPAKKEGGLLNKLKSAFNSPSSGESEVSAPVPAPRPFHGGSGQPTTTSAADRQRRQQLVSARRARRAKHKA
jgi:hypothetical protein